MAEFWILPIIQGFVQTEKCKVDLGRFDKTREAMEPVFEVRNLNWLTQMKTKTIYFCRLLSSL
jgi:hypothetical protein